jgi:tRNA G18 (ribose-2'-O)-methylase SpoU
LQIHHLEDLDSPLLDSYRELKRTNITRWEKWFIAEGKRVVARLLESDLEVHSVLLSEKRLDEFAPQIHRDCPVLVVPHDLCSQLVGFDFHTGVMACGRRPRSPDAATWLNNLARRADANLTVVACPNTTLPDNLGSIIRLSAAFSVDAICTGVGSADPYSRRCVRVSMGNVFSLPLIEPVDFALDLECLRSQGDFQILACNQSLQSRDIRHYDWPDRAVLVLGNEAHGIPEPILALSDQQLEIPISDHVDSLNVVTAATIALYERMLRGR